MKRSVKYVLKSLAESGASEWTPGMRLPNGHGHCSGNHHAKGETLRDMRDAGLIEYGKAPKHSLYGYRITDAGRIALADANKETSP